MKKGYVGAISQSGSQMVKAPHQVTSSSRGGKVKTGSDLRTGKGK